MPGGIVRPGIQGRQILSKPGAGGGGFGCDVNLGKGLEVAQLRADGLLRVRANLEGELAVLGDAAGAIKNVRAVPLGVLADAVDFLLQLLELAIEEAAVHGVVGVVRSLDRQLAHALQHVGDLLGRAFRRLDQRNTVVGVAHGLIEAPDLRGEARADGEARNVVNRAVDALAGRQLLHDRGEAAGVCAHGLLGIERPGVRVDDSHLMLRLLTKLTI